MFNTYEFNEGTSPGSAGYNSFSFNSGQFNGAEDPGDRSTAILSKQAELIAEGLSYAPIYGGYATLVKHPTLDFIPFNPAYFDGPRPSYSLVLGRLQKPTNIGAVAQNIIPVYSGSAVLSKEKELVSTGNSIIPVYSASSHLYISPAELRTNALDIIPVYTGHSDLPIQKALNFTPFNPAYFDGAKPSYSLVLGQLQKNVEIKVTGQSILPVYVGSANLSKPSNLILSAVRTLPIYAGSAVLNKTVILNFGSTGSFLRPIYSSISQLHTFPAELRANALRLLPTYSGQADLNTKHEVLNFFPFNPAYFSAPRPSYALVLGQLQKTVGFSATAQSFPPIYAGQTNLSTQDAVLNFIPFNPAYFDSPKPSYSLILGQLTTGSARLVATAQNILPIYGGSTNLSVRHQVLQFYPLNPAYFDAPRPSYSLVLAQLRKGVALNATGQLILPVYGGSAGLSAKHGKLDFIPFNPAYFAEVKPSYSLILAQLPISHASLNATGTFTIPINIGSATLAKPIFLTFNSYGVSTSDRVIYLDRVYITVDIEDVLYIG